MASGVASAALDLRGPRSRVARAIRVSRDGLLLALLFVTPLAIGTVHVWTKFGVFVAVAVLLLLTVLDCLERGRTLRVPPPAVGLLVAIGACLLQLLPVPAKLIAVISPAAHEIFGNVLGDYSYRPLSIDPAATLHECAKLTAYLAFFLAVGAFAARPRRRRLLLIIVVVCAVVVTAIGFLQIAVGADKLLFVYKTRAPWRETLRGSFVNPNHFAALVGLAAPCALILAIREERVRWFAFPALILLNIATVLSVSRGGMVASVIGQGAALFLDRWHRDRSKARSLPQGMRGAIAIASIMALLVGGMIGIEELAPKLGRTWSYEIPNPIGEHKSKFHVLGHALGVSKKFGLTGVGRGAFEYAELMESDQGGYVRRRWVENGYVQLFTDWGVPIAVSLIGIALWSMLIAVKRCGFEPLGVGALAAVIALGIHEAADFATELPGIAFPGLAVLATLFVSRRKEARGLQVKRWHLALPLVCVSLASLTMVVPRADAQYQAFSRQVANRQLPTETIIAKGRRLLEQHPADYYIPLQVSARLARELHPKSLIWINTAIYLNPTHPWAHLLAAEVLARTRHKSQALVEYRSAVGFSPQPENIWKRLVRRYPNIEDIIRATPEEIRILDRLAEWLLAKKRPEDAETIYIRSLIIDPEHLVAHRQLVRLALERHDYPLATQRIENLLGADSSEGSIRIAVLGLIEIGQLNHAAQLLDGIAGRSPDVFMLHINLADSLTRAGQLNSARERLKDLEWQVERSYRIVLHEARARLEERAGNWHQSEWENEQAVRLRGAPVDEKKSQ